MKKRKAVELFSPEPPKDLLTEVARAVGLWSSSGHIEAVRRVRI